MNKENKFFKIMRGLARGVFTLSMISFILWIATIAIYKLMVSEGYTTQWLSCWSCINALTVVSSGVFAIIGYIKEIATFISNQFKCE